MYNMGMVHQNSDACVARAALQVEQMQQANHELRALLNQYLASPVNKELQIPPTQVL